MVFIGEKNGENERELIVHKVIVLFNKRGKIEVANRILLEICLF